MPALQVKDCPSDVYERLRACAAEENRSIAQQTVAILRLYLDGYGSTSFDSTPVVSRSVRRYRSAHSIYEGECGSENYLAKREEAFRRIEKLHPIPITAERPRADVLLAEIREEEAR